jgi:hypothetical protein
MGGSGEGRDRGPRPPYLPPDPEEEYSQAGYPRPSIRHRLTDALILGGGALVLGVVLLVAAGYIGRMLDERDAQSTEIGSVEVGQCFDFAEPPVEADVLPPVRVVDCAAEHDGEVFGRIRWPDEAGGNDPMTPYPGAVELGYYGDVGCRQAFVEYLGAHDPGAQVQVRTTIPLRSAWRSLEHRTFDCLAAPVDGRRMTGSVRDPSR